MHNQNTKIGVPALLSMTVVVLILGLNISVIKRELILNQRKSHFETFSLK